MNVNWDIAFGSLFDQDGEGRASLLHGHDLMEWLSLVHHDWDEVDRQLIDLETVGG